MGLGMECLTFSGDMDIPETLDTDQAVASQRLSTPLQLSQKLMGLCCRSNSPLATS